MSTEQALAEESAAVERELAEAFGARNADALDLDVGAVLLVLAEGVVLPIVASFVSEVVVERWRRARSKREREAVRAEIAAGSLQPRPQVDEHTVLAEVLANLSAEGVPTEVAARVVRDAFGRVAARAAAGGSVSA